MESGDFIISGRVLTRYCGPGGEVTVPWGVTRIGANAFSNCSAVTAVHLPDSVLGIDNHAFYRCAGLRRVDFPPFLKEIGYAAFRGCGALEQVLLPDPVRELAFNVFSDCRALRRAVLPAELTQLEAAFVDCSSLESIEIAAENPHFYTVDGVLFSRDGALIRYPPQKKRRHTMCRRAYAGSLTARLSNARI
jgi:hypothetical protein